MDALVAQLMGGAERPDLDGRGAPGPGQRVRCQLRLVRVCWCPQRPSRVWTDSVLHSQWQ